MPAGHAHGMLGGIAAVATICALLVAFALRRIAPAASLGLLGTIPGGVGGFNAGASDGPAFAPAAAIVGATMGVLILGCVGIVVTDSRASRSARRRAALAVLIGGILTAAVLPYLLVTACPLYVTRGHCSYQGADLLGGWVTPFVMVYLFDVMTLTGLVLASPSWPE
jgi:hypothetical protein